MGAIHEVFVLRNNPMQEKMASKLEKQQI